jgi:hypothetical protein
MHRKEFLRLAGADQQSVEYLPVAVLLRSGYGCAGYYNTALNVGLDGSFVLMNATLIDLNSRNSESEGKLSDFNDFLEEVVIQYYKAGEYQISTDGRLGKSIPLAAIPMNEVSVLYPVAQIGKAMQFLENSKKSGLNAKPGAGLEPSDAKGPVVPRSTAPVKPSPAGSPAAGSNASRPQVKKMRPVPPAVVPSAPAAAKALQDTQNEEGQDVPSFLDFNNKSIVLAALRTKIW